MWCVMTDSRGDNELLASLCGVVLAAVAGLDDGIWISARDLAVRAGRPVPRRCSPEAVAGVASVMVRLDLEPARCICLAFYLVAKLTHVR